MEKYTFTAVTTAWTEVADNQDFVLQNMDKQDAILVSTGASAPTDDSGALELPAKGVISHVLLPDSKIWIKALKLKTDVSGSEIGYFVSVQK